MATTGVKGILLTKKGGYDIIVKHNGRYARTYRSGITLDDAVKIQHALKQNMESRPYNFQDLKFVEERQKNFARKSYLKRKAEMLKEREQKLEKPVEVAKVVKPVKPVKVVKEKGCDLEYKPLFFIVATIAVALLTYIVCGKVL